MVHLMLRVVVPEQSRDTRMCKRIFYVYTMFQYGGAVFESFSLNFTN